MPINICFQVSNLRHLHVEKHCREWRGELNSVRANYLGITISYFTILACPRRCSQVVWLRCTHPPTAGQLHESYPVHQSFPWICPPCETAPGRPHAFAVCHTAGTSAQKAVETGKKKKRRNQNRSSGICFRFLFWRDLSTFWVFLNIYITKRKVYDFTETSLEDCNFPWLKFKTWHKEE